MPLTIVTDRAVLKQPTEPVPLPINNSCFLAEIKIIEAYKWVKDPANGALGLAAPQVGSTYRWFVMRNPSDKLAGGDIIIVINPKMSVAGKPVTKIESCFSNPGKSSPVLRWPHVDVRFDEWDPVNHKIIPKRKLRFNGRSAQIFQHEFAHLKGKCIFDGETCPQPKP